MVATLFGNSLAMMAKEAVRNAAFPSASTIRITKAAEMKPVWLGIRSSSPKIIADVPVVKMPVLNNTFGPIRLMY